MSDAAEITPEELAELLLETGHHHHEAFLSTDGGDPEWALWYAGYLQSRLWDRAGTLPTRSLLVHLLIGAERDQVASGSEDPWPEHFARFILAGLAAP